jgi:hypothetical protein
VAFEVQPKLGYRGETNEWQALQNISLLDDVIRRVFANLLKDSRSTHFRHLFSSRSPESDVSGINGAESLEAANTPPRRSIYLCWLAKSVFSVYHGKFVQQGQVRKKASSLQL